jgi:molybdate transport system substrate-binding protein
MTRVATIFFVLCVLPVFCKGQGTEKIRLCAASDLKFALDSVIQVYQKKNPAVVLQVSYGSSGKLFEQVSNGAPFDIFFSADIEYPRRLQAKGLTESAAYVYGIGRIVLWRRYHRSSKFDMETLIQSDVKKIAIANPLHAPYGKRAVEALEHYQIYTKVKRKLVFGENISQAAQFVTSGAADVGIIALSLATSPVMRKMHGEYILIPQEAHAPLEQAFVLLKGTREKKRVQDFAEYVKGDEVKAILTYFGFMDSL